MRNYVELIGRLGSDPVVKKLEPSGTEYCNVTIATDDSYLDKDKKKVEVTDWHTVVAWRGVARSLGYCKKGKLVCIIGKMKTRKYTDKNDIERYITEVYADDVIFLEKMKDSDSGHHTDQEHRTPGNKSDISMM